MRLFLDAKDGEAVTGKLIAPLEAVEPKRAKGQESGLDEGRSGGVEESSDRPPEPERRLQPKGVERGPGR